MNNCGNNLNQGGSSDVQSPLNDQKKGVGFILVKNAIMKNAEGNFQSPIKEKSASTGDGSNFFTFLGIVIFLALMKFGPEIIDNLNREQQMSHASQMKQTVAQMGKAQVKNWDPFMKKYLAKNSLVPKKFVPDNDSQVLNQLNQNELLLNKLKKQNQDIQNQIAERNNNIEYLTKREKAQQLKELGTMILRFNQMGLYSWMN